MTKTELNEKIEAFITETREALQLVYNTLNEGQKTLIHQSAI